MTENDNKNILRFVTRTDMFIYPVDEKNVVSFIQGYELGTKNKCDFTKLLRQLLTRKYKTAYGNDGWPGQISRLAKKRSQNWITTFKKISLELVAENQRGRLDKTSAEILRERIMSIIERINAQGDPWFNDSWVEEWSSYCSIKSKWFKYLWTELEWPIIKSIDRHVQAGNVFSNKGKYIPTLQLLKLKNEFDKTTKKNGT